MNSAGPFKCRVLIVAWMQVGGSVGDFAHRVNDFSNEWKRLAKATKIVAGASQRYAVR